MVVIREVANGSSLQGQSPDRVGGFVVGRIGGHLAGGGVADDVRRVRAPRACGAACEGGVIAARVTPIEARILDAMIRANRIHADGYSLEILGDLAKRGLCEIRSSQEGRHAYPTAAGVTSFAMFQHYCCEQCGAEKEHSTERFCSHACRAAWLVATAGEQRGAA